MRWRFDRSSFLISIIIFFIEVLIAKFVDDAFIRPYGGDILVVILIYYFLSAFINISFWWMALFVLLFSYLVETLQYFNLVKILGLQHSRLARIVIGTSFSWLDILCYTVGIFIVILIENRKGNKPLDPQKQID